ncbi:hypothetical protein CY34DRAFT_804753 [Suillus luteus UH-Slu-Lm8-n1]|uniref:Unplaced genomic scaffold CY34scaffold_103, whole genome shotgun sequence n=1 Tax=Suillus luteus UH-Slu-Lm8-n1 TaxID=930992 RepID=A0A0C9ZXZ1_9AGAM|nr:hypothetical protein CY34DRAFT_804753 [Suillus luteus UH-Slu-Lm8-n1]
MVLWCRSPLRSAGRLSTASTTDVPFQDRSLLHISRACIPVPYPHPHQSQVTYYVMIRSSFSSGRQGIYPARSSPKLNSANSISVVSGFPSGLADISSFSGQLLNLDVSHDLDLSDSPIYKGSTTVTFDSCPDRSSNRWGRIGKEKTWTGRMGPTTFQQEPC